MDEIRILPFSKKGDLGIIKYQGSIYFAAPLPTIYSPAFNRFRPEVVRDFMKSSQLLEKSIDNFSDSGCSLNHWVHSKNLEVTLLFLDLSKSLEES